MFQLRKAAIDDAPLLNQLAREVFPLTYRDILSPEQNEFMFEWMYAVDNIRQQMLEGHCYFILEDEDQACGYMSIQQEEKLFHLHKIYVLPSCQKSGAGRFLFEQALTYIKSIHPSPCRMELRVNRENPAVGFYKKMGMKVLRSDDLDIGRGYLMNDYIMGIDL
ncbi:MAG: GNAT family N-acetyltransferase [Bacteroidales bacterium]